MRSKNQSHIKQMLYLSIVLCLYQAIANTQLSIFSQFTNQNHNSWVGSLCIALLFLGSGCASVMNFYIKSGKYRLILFTGSFGYTIFISTSIIFLTIGFQTVALVFMILFSLIGGIIVSLLYNGSFNYINHYSRIDNQPSKYFGISIGIMQSANIIGNCISAILIKPLGQLNYAITMQVLIFCISILLLRCNNIKQDALNIIKQQQLLSQKQLSIIQIPKFPKQIIICFIFSGIMISFVYGELSVIIYNNFSDMEINQLNQVTFIIFVVEGIGQFLGGILIGCFSSYFTKISKIYLFVGVLFVLSIVIIFIGSQFHNLYVLGLGSFIVGFCDCLGYSLALSIAGKWKQFGISAFNLGQSVTVAITTIMIPFVNPYIIMIWNVLMQILCAFVLLKNETILNSQIY